MSMHKFGPHCCMGKSTKFMFNQSQHFEYRIYKFHIKKYFKTLKM